MNTTRPVTRYFGSKWRIAPWIIGHFPAHRTYVEPFGGSASVLLRKPRVYAEVYNDLDGEIVNLFRVLRSPVEASELVRLVSLTPFARHEFELAYQPTDDPVEQARRTLIKGGMGFGSNSIRKRTGFRSNTTRSGTTPAHDWSRLPEPLTQIIERLRGVIIEERPALDVIRRYTGPQTLIYCDPPYVHDTRGLDGRYRHEMSDDEHEQLAAVLTSTDAMVVVSGYRCDLYDHIYAGWQRVDRATHADGARDRVESLWLSPNVQLQGRLLL